MYIVYLLVVIIGRFLHQNLRRRRLAEALLHQVSKQQRELFMDLVNVVCGLQFDIFA